MYTKDSTAVNRLQFSDQIFNSGLDSCFNGFENDSHSFSLALLLSVGTSSDLEVVA